MEEGTGESGLHHQALNDLGHSPFPFILWSWWELDQGFQGPAGTDSLWEFQRAEKARESLQSVCLHARVHAHTDTDTGVPARIPGKGKGRRGLGRWKC